MTTAHALLLLPEAPQYPTFSNVKVALHPPIRASLKTLQKHSEALPRDKGLETNSSVLDIALPVSRLATSSPTHQEFLEGIQLLLTSVFTLIATIYRCENIRSDSSEGVDTRIIIVEGQAEELDDLTRRRLACCAVHFGDLACSGTTWTHLFLVESPAGEKLYLKFRSLVDKASAALGPTWKLQRLEGGLQLCIARNTHTDTGKVTSFNAPTGRDIWVFLPGEELNFDDKYALALGHVLVEVPPSGVGATAASSQQGTLHIAVANRESCGCNEPRGVYRRELVEYVLGTNNFSQTNPPPSHFVTDVGGYEVCTVATIKQSQWIKWAISSAHILSDQELSRPTTVIVSNPNMSMVVTINQKRREQGWAELDVLEIGRISSDKSIDDESVD